MHGQHPGSYGDGELVHRRGREVGSGVGDSGDAISGQLPSELAEAGEHGDRITQEMVCPPQSPFGGFGLLECYQAGVPTDEDTAQRVGVEVPERAAAVLDT